MSQKNSYAYDKNANPANKKPKRRLTYRLSFIFLFVLVSFVFCFTMYMKNEEDLVLPGGIFAPSVQTEAEMPEDAVLITTAAEKGGVNPVPLSKTADESVLENSLFVGCAVLSGLSEFDIAPNEAVIADINIKSSNLGNIVVRRGNSNKTVKSIIMDEKVPRLYIMFTPEAELDTAELSDFCEDITSNNKRLDVYFISSLPGAGADDFNAALLDFADENGVYYLDFNTDIVGNDGRLMSDFSDEDGNLNRDGYEFLKEYLLTHEV
jgi:hypothetical protein